jgi:hypothetical protein
MASIVYVSDKDMLEFHRLNGNREINFWRISTKRFTGFKPGDLLFFLSKRPEDLKNKEKGIIGYGCLVETKSMSCSQMWNTYGEKNGFATKKELTDAIIRIAKDNRIPKKINCLLLKDVQFFQGPVFLSELGMKVASNLESFSYIDTEENRLTLAVLNKARTIGIDTWSSTQGTVTSTAAFEQELMKYQIASICEYTGFDKWPVDKRYAQQCFKQYEHYQPLWINASHNAFIGSQDKETVYLIYQTRLRDEKENYLRLLGFITALQSNLQRQEQRIAKIVVLTDLNVSNEQQQMAAYVNAKICRLKKETTE